MKSLDRRMQDAAKRHADTVRRVEDLEHAIGALNLRVAELTATVTGLRLSFNGDRVGP